MRRNLVWCDLDKRGGCHAIPLRPGIVLAALPSASSQHCPNILSLASRTKRRVGVVGRMLVENHFHASDNSKTVLCRLPQPPILARFLVTLIPCECYAKYGMPLDRVSIFGGPEDPHI